MKQRQRIYYSAPRPREVPISRTVPLEGFGRMLGHEAAPIGLVADMSCPYSARRTHRIHNVIAYDACIHLASSSIDWFPTYHQSKRVQEARLGDHARSN
jgi:hypothetical protein